MRTDEEIKKDIVDELYWDSRIDASNVTVTVDNGVATLSGSVPLYGDRAACRWAALRIQGVIEVVDDDLEVAYPTPPALPDDTEIQQRAYNILAWEPTIDETSITVSVVGGNLVVEGTVDAYWKRSFAETRIGRIRGIYNVDNRLAVVPSQRVDDELIAKDVVGALERDFQVDPDDVTVAVNDGIVTLSGSVPSWAARRAAESDAVLTSGVIGVRNELGMGA